MKIGPIILILLGLGLVTFLYLSPVVPAGEEKASSIEEVTHKGLSPEQRVDEAIRQLESGELPPMQAILKIRDVANEYPKNVKANFTLGLMSMQTGQYEKAVGRFETVLQVQTENVDAMQFLAQAYLNLGDTNTAKENYSKALVLSQDSAQRAVIETQLNNIN